MPGCRAFFLLPSPYQRSVHESRFLETMKVFTVKCNLRRSSTDAVSLYTQQIEHGCGCVYLEKLHPSVLAHVHIAKHKRQHFCKSLDRDSLPMQ